MNIMSTDYKRVYVCIYSHNIHVPVPFGGTMVAKAKKTPDLFK